MYINSDKASWWPLESCLLALKPLSAITDEHAILVAKMAGKTGDDKYLINYGQMHAILYQNRKATDTLRLLGYDMGYLDIPSLIKDGRFACDITKINKLEGEKSKGIQ